MRRDRGSPYASEDYWTALRERGIVASMSRTGDCWDVVRHEVPLLDPALPGRQPKFDISWGADGGTPSARPQPALG